MLEKLIGDLKQKYKGIRYSNLLKDREWWFTISPESFNTTLYLMLIDKSSANIRILKIKTTEQFVGILPRKEGVYLSGQYDLYFSIDKKGVLKVRYLTSSGYVESDVSMNVLEFIEIEKYLFTNSPVIETLEDLIDNLLTIEAYLGGDYSEEERKFAMYLIQRGHNFVAYKVQSEWHFAPSRFVGYKDNNMYKHLNNDSKDGKETTPIINGIAKKELCFDPILEKAYIEYCELLNIELHHNKRQYWFFDFTDTSFEKLANKHENRYQEGRLIERRHKKRERNRKLVEEAKRRFRNKHNGQIYCEICGFNFMSTYDIDYIEVHHLKALMDMEEGDVTSLDDVCLVCSNCHRVIHSQYPFLTMDQVTKLIKSRQ